MFSTLITNENKNTFTARCQCQRDVSSIGIFGSRIGIGIAIGITISFTVSFGFGIVIVIGTAWRVLVRPSSSWLAFAA